MRRNIIAVANVRQIEFLLHVLTNESHLSELSIHTPTSNPPDLCVPAIIQICAQNTPCYNLVETDFRQLHTALDLESL